MKRREFLVGTGSVAGRDGTSGAANRGRMSVTIRMIGVCGRARRNGQSRPGAGAAIAGPDVVRMPARRTVFRST